MKSPWWGAVRSAPVLVHGSKVASWAEAISEFDSEGLSPHECERSDLELRTVRALTEVMTVVPDVDDARGADDPREASDYVHEILRDHVNFLLTENPRVQFVVEDLEYWDEPVLRDGDDEIPLQTIFHGIEQEGSGWYFSNVNVQS